MGWRLAGVMVAVGKVVFVADGVGVRVGLLHRVGVVVGVLEGVKLDVGMGVAELFRLAQIDIQSLV
jgi:hypothetical protein